MKWTRVPSSWSQGQFETHTSRPQCTTIHLLTVQSYDDTELIHDPFLFLFFTFSTVVASPWSPDQNPEAG